MLRRLEEVHYATKEVCAVANPDPMCDDAGALADAVVDVVAHSQDYEDAKKALLKQLEDTKLQLQRLEDAHNTAAPAAPAAAPAAPVGNSEEDAKRAMLAKLLA